MPWPPYQNYYIQGQTLYFYSNGRLMRVPLFW